MDKILWTPQYNDLHTNFWHLSTTVSIKTDHSNLHEDQCFLDETALVSARCLIQDCLSGRLAAGQMRLLILFFFSKPLWFTKVILFHLYMDFCLCILLEHDHQISLKLRKPYQLAHLFKFIVKSSHDIQRWLRIGVTLSLFLQVISPCKHEWIGDNCLILEHSLDQTQLSLWTVKKTQSTCYLV